MAGRLAQRCALLLALGLAGAGGCKDRDAATRAIGAPCEDDVACEERCLPAVRWPSGFCSIDCASRAECPAATDCIATEVDGTVCLFACFDDRDCAFLDDLGGEWSCQELEGPSGRHPVCAPKR